jgi:hypothetical protein
LENLGAVEPTQSNGWKLGSTGKYCRENTEKYQKVLEILFILFTKWAGI